MPTSFRPEGPDDEPLLFELYSSTRADEMAMIPWNDAQKEAFLGMQFRAQRDHYRSRYKDARYDIILEDGRPVGRLYVAKTEEDETQILDITILPQERGRGLGTPIIKELMEEAEREGRRLTIYVEGFNPSLRLFERLGFEKAAEEGPYFLMEWRSAAAPGS